MILYSQWKQLPLPIRHKIAIQFNIGKTKPTHVSNNEIVDDGYELKNIESQLTVANLQTYLGSTETDLTILWIDLVNHMTGKTRVAEPVSGQAISLPEELKVIAEPITLEPIIEHKERTKPEDTLEKPKKKYKTKKTKKTGNVKS